MNEFSLIDRYLAPLGIKRSDTCLGIGDDAAIVRVPADHDLVLCLDTMVEGRHFVPSTKPEDLGYKILAVNLSDMAAMGATPRWVTMGLTLPKADPQWLENFCQGMNELLTAYHLELVGGDTTKGPLSISVQIQGTVPIGAGLTRRGAKAGDSIVVSGTLGDGLLGLDVVREKKKIEEAQHKFYLLKRLTRPTPRVELGQQLLPFATSAIDISDGLIGDLGHILKQSQVGAIIYCEHLPLSEALRNNCSRSEAVHLALSGGDDYELCFTMNKQEVVHLGEIGAKVNCPLTIIGEITETPGLSIIDDDGKPYSKKVQGFDHFEE